MVVNTNQKAPHFYTRTQQMAISQLANACSCSAQTAIAYLNAYDWRVNYAADVLLKDRKQKELEKKKTEKIATFFNSYSDSQNTDEINIDGTIRFFNDINVDLNDTVALAISCVLNAPSAGKFIKSEFIKGMVDLKADSLEGLKTAIEKKIRPEMKQYFPPNNKLYKSVYRYTYNIILPETHKSLPTETAVEYWKMLITSDNFPLIDTWCKFVLEEYKHTISRDTWNMLYEFTLFAKEDPKILSYDASGAWPSIIDEFVVYIHNKNE